MKINIFLLTALCLLLFCGCNSDNKIVETIKYPIEGLWIGTQTCDNDHKESSDNFYSMVVYEDGSILTKGKGSDGNTYYATGSWSLSSNNLFTATITTLIFRGPPVTQAFTFTYSDSGVLTNGRWKDTLNGTQLGHFSTMRHIPVTKEKADNRIMNSFLSSIILSF